MRTQIEIDNVNLNATNFLKWIANNQDKESNYLKCKLKDLEIEVEEEDLIALIGNDGREIFLNYFDYEDVSDFISMDELIENNIIEKPLFVVTADFADDLYVTDTCVVGITDDYELAQSIANDTNGDIDLAQMNKRINIQAGAYIE
jgi:hypothetical protein